MQDMKPGRELDALVAEKVMGCHTVADATGVLKVRGEYTPVCACPNYEHNWPIEHPDPIYSGTIPPYSASIEAAWEVVEKLAHDSELTLEIYPGLGECEVSVQWYDAEQGHGPYYFCRPTAPHAISLAALKAVGA